MQINLDDAYAEACRALGEAIVKQRFLLAELERRDDAAATEPTVTEP